MQRIKDEISGKSKKDEADAAKKAGKGDAKKSGKAGEEAGSTGEKDPEASKKNADDK